MFLSDDKLFKVIFVIDIMTTGKEIMNVLKEEPSFAGVYLYDQLRSIPMHKLHDKAIIINYVTSEEAEQNITGHYVCLSNTKAIKEGFGPNKGRIKCCDELKTKMLKESINITG